MERDWIKELTNEPWFLALADCPQDPIHHAEGDVLIHTRMVLEALQKIPAFKAATKEHQLVLQVAAILHDVAKPECTKVEEDGRVTSRGHSRRGEFMARQILWKMGFPFHLREQVTTLVRYHQVPFHLLEREDPRRLVHRLSQTTRCDLLSIVAEADLRGRVCQDFQQILDNIELFREFCQEENCYTQPRPFPSEHSRYLYFRKEGRDPNYPAFDDTWGEVIMLCGLPGSGKNYWIQQHAPELPVISLDDIRKDIDVTHNQNQGPVLAEADARARALLRAKKPFIWNATSLQRQLRSSWIDLFGDYHAKIRIVYIEVPVDVLAEQNRNRKAVVPWGVIEKMMQRWEVPDLTEAHFIDHYVRPA